MKVVYYSRNGKVKRFAEKVVKEDPNIIIESVSEYSGGNYVFITPTYGHGEVPQEVTEFLDKNGENMVAVASSGNRVWGLNLFANSGNTVSMLYKVPLIMKFENQGLASDVQKFIKGLELVGLD